MTNLEIDAFLTVVRLGSITAAAQAIFITQPALSRRILALEEELGYLLFCRGKGQRSIQLTEEGKAFIAVAEKVLQQGGLRRYPLRQAPPDRIIYSVLGRKEENALTGHFLEILKETLAQNPCLELLQ